MFTEHKDPQSPTLLTTDADFLAAERQLAEVRAELTPGSSDRMWALYDQITLSPPVSLVSSAVKLRLLSDPDIGLAASDGEDDVAAVRQVFELVERVASGDCEILSLFRQWIAAHLAAQQISKTIGDSPEFNAAIDRVCDLEYAIPKIPAQGLIGCAIKAYLIAHHELTPAYGAHPAGLGTLGPDEYGGNGSDLPLGLASLVSLIRDAARFVPEIATLAVLLIGEARP
jgi:hypothetical protein